MESESSAQLLRIYVEESDKARGRLLYEAIVLAAREAGMAGATVLRGIEGFGAGSVIHRARFVEIASKMPMVIEVVDQTDKIRAFIPEVKNLFDESGSGGLITLEKVEIVSYQPRK